MSNFSWQSKFLIVSIRIGIGFLFFANALHLFFPENLQAIAYWLPLQNRLVISIKGYPGFNQDWVFIASLIEISIYIYAYLLIILTATAMWLDVPRVDQNSEANNRRRFLEHIFPVNDDLKFLNPKRANALLMSALMVCALTYMGYASLTGKPIQGGVFARLVDTVFVSLWCYSIFSLIIFLPLLAVRKLK